MCMPGWALLRGGPCPPWERALWDPLRALKQLSGSQAPGTFVRKGRSWSGGRALAQLGGILAGIALAGDGVGFSGRAMLAAGGLEALAGRALGMCTAAVGSSLPQAWAPVLREALAQHI